MRLILALAAALLAATPAAAQPGGLIDFPPGARAEQDGFVAAIVTTGDLEGFARAWTGDVNLQPKVTRTAVRGRELSTLILLQDCRPAADGKCNVTARFTYLLPGGAEYGTINDDDLWTQAPRADGGISVALGRNLVVDPPDPMGQWTLRGEIRDNVRGVTVTVETPIVVDSPPTAAAN